MEVIGVWAFVALNVRTILVENTWFSGHQSVVIKNLDFIKNDGLDNWLKEQKARWSCSGCGLNISWYDEKCGSCGSKVFNCKNEEAELE